MDSLLYVFVILVIIMMVMLIVSLLGEQCSGVLLKRKNRRKYGLRVVDIIKVQLKEESMQEIQQLLSARPCTDKLPPSRLDISDYNKMQEAKEALQCDLDHYLSIMELIAIFRSNGTISEKAFEENFEKCFNDIKANPGLSLYVYRCAFMFLELNRYITCTV